LDLLFKSLFLETAQKQEAIAMTRSFVVGGATLIVTILVLWTPFITAYSEQHDQGWYSAEASNRGSRRKSSVTDTDTDRIGRYQEQGDQNRPSNEKSPGLLPLAEREQSIQTKKVPESDFNRDSEKNIDSVELRRRAQSSTFATVSMDRTQYYEGETIVVNITIMLESDNIFTRLSGWVALFAENVTDFTHSPAITGKLYYELHAGGGIGTQGYASRNETIEFVGVTFPSYSKYKAVLDIKDSHDPQHDIVVSKSFEVFQSGSPTPPPVFSSSSDPTLSPLLASPTPLSPTRSPTTLHPTVFPTTLSPRPQVPTTPTFPTPLSPTRSPTTLPPTVFPTTLSPRPQVPTTPTFPTPLSPTRSPTTLRPTALPPSQTPTTLFPIVLPTTLPSTRPLTALLPTAVSATLPPTRAPKAFHAAFPKKRSKHPPMKSGAMTIRGSMKAFQRY
jgi:hypothetical protein